MKMNREWKCLITYCSMDLPNSMPMVPITGPHNFYTMDSYFFAMPRVSFETGERRN